MTSEVHPDAVLEQLLAATHRPERQAALRKLHAICEAQSAGTAKDFRVATIGAIAEKLGVLKKKTLSNKSSAGLLTLIQAWEIYAGGNKSHSSDPARSVIQEKLSSISDPALRALIQGRLAERDRLIAQVNLLKAATTIVVDRTPPLLKDPASPAPTPLQLPDSEVSAVREVLSPEFLADEGWVEGGHGEICDAETGRRIFPKGFMSALRRILGPR